MVGRAKTGARLFPRSPKFDMRPTSSGSEVAEERCSPSQSLGQNEASQRSVTAAQPRGPGQPAPITSSTHGALAPPLVARQRGGLAVDGETPGLPRRSRAPQSGFWTERPTGQPDDLGGPALLSGAASASVEQPAAAGPRPPHAGCTH